MSKFLIVGLTVLVLSTGAYADEVPAEALPVAAAVDNTPMVFKVVNTSLFVASETVLLMDFLQTWNIDYRWGYRERNPFLGGMPSSTKVVGYFGTLMLTHALVYAFAPRWVSSSLSTVTLSIEVPVIVGNFKVGTTLFF